MGIDTCPHELRPRHRCERPLSRTTLCCRQRNFPLSVCGMQENRPPSRLQLVLSRAYERPWSPMSDIPKAVIMFIRCQTKNVPSLRGLTKFFKTLNLFFTLASDRGDKKTGILSNFCEELICYLFSFTLSEEPHKCVSFALSNCHAHTLISFHLQRACTRRKIRTLDLPMECSTRLGGWCFIRQLF